MEYKKGVAQAAACQAQSIPFEVERYSDLNRVHKIEQIDVIFQEAKNYFESLIEKNILFVNEKTKTKEWIQAWIDHWKKEGFAYDTDTGKVSRILAALAGASRIERVFKAQDSFSRYLNSI